MDLLKRKQAFATLGRALRLAFDDKNDSEKLTLPAKQIENLITESKQAKTYNGWFDEQWVKKALRSIGESLTEESLNRWLSSYKIPANGTKTVGVIMAGNIPAVGFHDFLTVLISGNKLLAKLSSDDNRLLPAIARILIAIEPEFESEITFTEGTIKSFDAVIATGSNNTARYFEYYFGKYPNIIRKNRNGVAVLTGKESDKELTALADDIFSYYGLGCRNVSKLFIPKEYDFERLLSVLNKFKMVTDNHKYFNNYEYNKAIFLVNKVAHKDTGNLLLRESTDFASPVSVLNYEFYHDKTALRNYLLIQQERIQCVVSNADFLKNTIPFGKSQQPELWDYADGVDTMEFLIRL